MPFDATEGAIYGTDAVTPAAWARVEFCNWLGAKLNDESGPYASGLGVTAQRKTIVTENGRRASVAYSHTLKPPVIEVTQGPIDEMDWRKQIGSTIYNGQRLMIECALDCGVGDRTPTQDNIQTERDDENNLVGFLTDAITQGYSELSALGLMNVIIAPNGERGGRNPQKLTFHLRTLRDWEPEI